MFEFYNNDRLDFIDITLSMGCKLNCRYCPQSKLLNEYFKEDKKRTANMTMEDFKEIVSKVKIGGKIVFAGMCEPFHNPDCADMIVYAYENGRKVSLYTTLVGITKEDIYKLKSVEFEYITLHIPDREGNSKFNITEEYLEILKLFHENFKIRYYSCHGQVHPRIMPYIKTDLWVANEDNMVNRAGNLSEGIKTQRIKDEIICIPGSEKDCASWTPEVLPDGTVVLCCMDYGMKHILGNLVDMSVSDILNSEGYKFIKNGMKDNSLDILCRECNMAVPISNTAAYRFSKKFEEFKNGKFDDLTKEQLDILKTFDESIDICVFGLGKVFGNSFVPHGWNNVLNIKYYTDNNSSLWGKSFYGIECIEPIQIKDLSNPLVVTSITDDTQVRKQFNDIGVKNIINIMELYDVFGCNNKSLKN